MAEKLLEVKDLRVSYHTMVGEVQSVRGVSFDMDKGETIAIVGESGCGKSVTARTIMHLTKTPPAEIKEGSQILFNGEDVLTFEKDRLRQYRGGDAAIIFQDALAALKAQTTDKGWTVPVDIPTNIQLNAASDGANELPEFLIDNIGVGTERFEYNSYWTTSWSINYDECFEQSSTCTEEYDWDCYCISPGINANIVKPIYEDGEGFIKLGEIIEQNAKYGSGVRPVITVPKNQIG